MHALLAAAVITGAASALTPTTLALAQPAPSASAQPQAGYALLPPLNLPRTLARPGAFSELRRPWYHLVLLPRRHAAYAALLAARAARVAPAAGVVSGQGVAPAAASYGGAFGIWDCIAQYEGSPPGNWATDTGNGYYGGLQFTESTWLGYGGGAYASYADNASASQQVAVARKVLAAQGWGAWPVSSQRCGAGSTQTVNASRIYVSQTRHRHRHHRRHPPLRLRLLRAARTQAGKPYYYGAAGPDAYDCSGLVYWAYHRVTGRWGPRDTGEMLAAIGSFMVQVSRPEKGDLAFYGSGHVEIWLRGGWAAGATFGAHDSGSLVGRIRYSQAWGWAPTMYFAPRWPAHRNRRR